jgi:glycosyltransferase involved in cell wall biosynthesis
VRILIVSQYFWPEAFRVNDLALGLGERGHEVTVLTGMPNYPGGRLFDGYGLAGPYRESFRGIAVYRVPLTPRRHGRGWHLAANYLSFALSASLLGPLRIRGKFDLIFVFEPSPITVGLPAMAMKAVKRAPIVFWVQDLWPESLEATGAVRSRLVLRSVAALARFIYRSCDRVLVQSAGFIPRISALGVPTEKLAWLPNWAEEVYRPVTVGPDATERRSMPEGFRVVFAGNIGQAQSFATILAAAERLRSHLDIQWVILGDGRERAWVEAEIVRRGLTGSVRLLGQHPVESMPTYFALADVMLVTLRKDPAFALTIPSKIQSYQACARPIAASLDGEGAEIVRASGCGIACSADDADGLADAVLTLSRMTREERERIGAKGRAYFLEHFERGRLLDRLEGWMTELAGAH